MSLTGKKQDRAVTFKQERLRHIRGLTLIALAILLFAVLRAGLGHVFTPGWWRFW